MTALPDSQSQQASLEGTKHTRVEGHLRVLAKHALLAGCPEPESAVLTVENGIITDIERTVVLEPLPNDLIVPEGCVLLPGLVDCHVHLNEPGRTQWEGFRTGTTAAISGGVSTLVDMPLNSIPPTTTVANLEEKRAAASTAGVSCDVAFWGGIIPGNQADLVPLLNAGVKGFKCFLIESGVEEFPCVSESDLVLACDALQDTGALILFHAELGGEALSDAHHGKQNEYATFLSSRPQTLEIDALQLILRLARSYPLLRFHVVHLSAADALPAIREARQQGVNNLTVETCFHYLTLRSEDIPNNATQFKCCPPIRAESNRQLLLEAVIGGTIDYVVSDHSPCVAELKRGDFMTAWGGVSGLGLGLPLLWTELRSRWTLAKIVETLSCKQAVQVGLRGRKGELATGADADFVIFDPEASFEVTLDSLQFRNKVSPYIGRRLQGLVKQTWLRGSLAWDGVAGRRDGALL